MIDETRFGIFARTFPRSTAAQVAAEVAGAGFPLAHWNFAALGLPTLADGVEAEEFAAVRAAFDAVGIRIPSMSATYNMANSDSVRQCAETRQAARLIRSAHLLGAETVTLCTGTRDPHGMWRAHPDNTTAAAWHDMRGSLEVLLVAASANGVVLGIEPEPGNVVRDAATAVRLLDELGGDAPVGIVFDPANLLTPRTVDQQERILTEAVELLGSRIVGVQLKDLAPDGSSAVAGTGLMNYPLVFRLLERIAPVPLIVQDVTEAEAAGALRYLRNEARHEYR